MGLGAGLDGTKNLASAGILSLSHPARNKSLRRLSYPDRHLQEKAIFVLLAVRCANTVPRGVLPTVVRRCVWSRNLVNEEAVAHWGLSRQNQTTNMCKCSALHTERRLIYRLRLPVSFRWVRHKVLVTCGVLMKMTTRFAVFWDVTPCSLLLMYRRSRETFWFHLTEMMEASGSSETSAYIYNNTCCHSTRQYNSIILLTDALYCQNYFSWSVSYFQAPLAQNAAPKQFAHLILHSDLNSCIEL